MGKAVAIIQARVGSTRLPGKCLEHICGRPMIAHVAERALVIPGVDAVVVATVRRDAEAFHWALRGLPACLFWYDGCEENDVLGRYAAVARRFNASTLLRLTGDCPLLAPEVCGRVLAEHRAGELTTNASAPWIAKSGYPDGTDCDVFDRDLLERADREATEPEDREHVSRWMSRHAAVHIVTSERDDSALRLCVDTQEDLERVRAIGGRVKAGAFDLASTLEAARPGRRG